MKRSNKQTILLIGLGMMSASLSLAIKKRLKGVRILGMSRRAQTITKAKRLKLIEDGGTKAAEWMGEADLIIIATPVKSIQKYIELAEKHGKKGVIVTDLGSTKLDIDRWALTQALKKAQFVGSHPMCGSHKSGVNAGIKELYTSRMCFVTPNRKSNPTVVKKVVQFWKKIGMKVTVCSAEEHDRHSATSSHFPHLLAFALAHHTSHLLKKGEAFIGTGLNGITRMALSNEEVWIDIIRSNPKFILDESKRMQKELKKLEKLIVSKDTRGLRRYLKKANDIRGSYKV